MRWACKIAPSEIPKAHVTVGLVSGFPRVYGDYELLELVETAPLYELFVARRRGDAKRVLLKRVTPLLETHAPSTEVFAAAEKIASSLVHPRIVRTDALGIIGSSYFVTMEHASGVDLAAVQRELAANQRELAVHIAMWIAHEILDALDHAHNKSIVHGDLTASRVLLDASGDVKVKEFGPAQALHRAKFGDASPLDARDDLLAVGILLAELVTGWRLFVSAQDTALWPKLEQIQPALIETDLAFADLVLKALRREPSKRWQTAAAFRDAIREWLFDRGHHVTSQDVIAAVMSSLGGKDRSPRGTPVEGVPITPPLVAEPAPRQTTRGKLHPSRGGAPAPSLARGTERTYEPIKPTKAPASDSFTDAYNATLPAPTPPAIDPAGSFSAVASPVRILFRLATSRATGLFVVSSGAVKKQISIHDGQVEWVTSNMAGERFDAYLAKRQLVSTRDLAGAVRMMSDHVDVVDTIMGLGLLQPRELRRHLTDHLRATLVDVCTWKRGNYVWYAKDSAKPRVEGVSVDLFDALGAAASTAVSDSTISEWAASHATLTPSPTPRVDPDRFHVDGLATLLISVGKSASVDQLAGSQRDSRQRLLRMLYLLEACELVVPG